MITEERVVTDGEIALVERRFADGRKEFWVKGGVGEIAFSASQFKRLKQAIRRTDPFMASFMQTFFLSLCSILTYIALSRMF